MWITADVSGAPRMRPGIPKMAPNPIVATRTRSGFIAAWPRRDRLHHVLQQAVRKQDDDEHDQRGLRTLRAQRENAKAPDTKAPMKERRQ